MELQTLFNMAVQHLVRQDQASMLDDDPTVCAYRGEGCTKCAVGYLVSDSNYTERMEEKPCDEAVVLDALENTLNAELSDTHVQMLIDLQRLHDNQYHKMLDNPEHSTIELFVKRVQAIAGEYGLIIPRAVNDYVQTKAQWYLTRTKERT